MPLGIDFWMDFGGFLVPKKWSQVGIKIGSKIDFNFERRFFKKTLFSQGRTTFFEIKWVEGGNKHGANMNKKM